MSDKEESTVDTYLMLGCFFVFGGYIAYALFGQYYSVGWFYIKYLTVSFLYYLDYFTKGFLTAVLFFWVDGFSDIVSSIYPKMDKLARDADAQAIINFFYDGESLNDKYHLVNNFIKISLLPYIALLFCYFSFRMFYTKSYKRVYSVDSLAKQESELWPQIKVALWDNPIHHNLNSGKWAMSEKPYRYLERKKIVIRFKNDDDEDMFKIDFSKLLRELTRDLGEAWKSVDSLPYIRKQVFAILAAKAMRDSDLSRKVSYQVARSYTSEKTIYNTYTRYKDKKLAKKMVNEVIDRYKNNKDLQEIIDKHFYTMTVFAGLLEAARVDGVLASADFLWLKTVDRPLWYMLNNTGRRACFAECSGPWCHFLVEKAVKRSIATPMVSSAVDAFDEYLFHAYPSYDTPNEYEEK